MILCTLLNCNKEETVVDPCDTTYDLGQIKIADFSEQYAASYEGISKLIFKNSDGEEVVYTLARTLHEFTPKTDTFRCEFSVSTPDQSVPVNYEVENHEYLYTAPYMTGQQRFINISSSTSFQNPQPNNRISIEGLEDYLSNATFLEVGTYTLSGIPPSNTTRPYSAKGCAISIRESKTEASKLELQEQIMDSLRLNSTVYYNVIGDCETWDLEGLRFSNVYVNKELGLFSYYDGMDNDLWILDRRE